MPDLGGSYFTFSNENNDLIWGFLAECHRRGWLYKGHDTMPWCTRCGTGMSQHEMTEGYRDRDDPGLTIELPLVDRPGESLLVWTTTPWTLTSNVAAAVGPNLRYVQVRQGDSIFWLARGTLKTALDVAAHGPFEVLGELTGSELVGWRYEGPFDDLPAVRRAFAADREPAGVRASGRAPGARSARPRAPGIVHIAPGCGAEDFALGKSLGLPVIAPLDEAGIYLEGFGSYTGRDVRDVTEPIVEHLRAHHRFYRLETITHRYPHCWRCGTPLVFRLVDEWYISMGEVYDRPLEELTAGRGRSRACATRSWPWSRTSAGSPAFGYERELDWLLNMHDWMISKKRYWGLALPIYDCQACGRVEVIGGRDELHERAVEGWPAFEGHTPHRPYIDAVKIGCPGCGGAGRAGCPTSATSGSTPASSRSRRSTTARIRPTGPTGSRSTSSPRAFPASSATGSTRCSRCRRSCAARRPTGRSSATPRCWPRTARRCTRAPATRSSSTRRPSGWASTSCAGCMPAPGPTTTSCSAGRRPTKRAGGC